MRKRTGLYILIIANCVFILLILYARFAPYKPVDVQKKYNSPVVSNNRKISNHVTVSLVGDILLASRVGEKIKQFGNNYPFEKVKDYLSASDLAIGNLESSAAITGSATRGKRYTFKAEPNVLAGAEWSGIDILSVANNHVLDFGNDAFLETLSNIKSHNMSYIGAGKDIDEAFKPVIVEKNGKKIAIFGASRVIPYVSWYAGKNHPGVAGVYNPERLLQEMSKIRGQVDFIFIYLHWGNEKQTAPSANQRKLAKLLIDNGADVVAGSHSHVLQGFEFYKGKFIAYSLGNFIFTNFGVPTVILNIKMDDSKINEVGITPCIINNYVPELVAADSEKQKIYDMLERRSLNVKIVNGTIYENNNESESKNQSW